MTFEDYKTEIKIWQGSTTVDKSKQGGRVFNSLKGKAREIARTNVDTDKINTDDGVKLILEVLGKEWQEDKAHSGFKAFTDFTQFKRPKSMTISDFVLEFTIKYNKLKTYGMEIQDTILAFYFLSSANITAEQSQICLGTATPLSYANHAKTS